MTKLRDDFYNFAKAANNRAGISALSRRVHFDPVTETPCRKLPLRYSRTAFPLAYRKQGKGNVTPLQARCGQEGG
jgi:hypothetical protein